MFAILRTDLFQSFCDWDAKGGVAVDDCYAEMKLRTLAAKVRRDERLAKQFHTLHLRLRAASAGISAPLSPERAAQILRCPYGLITSRRYSYDLHPSFAFLRGEITE